MAYVELCLHLDCDLKRVAPEVRAWVDLDPDGQHTRETELALERRRAGSEWYGTFAVAEGGPRCVLYRVALVAHAGAEWSLSMYQRQRSRALLSDRDTLAMAKGWLVGTCELAQDDRDAWRPRPAPSGRSFTSMRAVPDGCEMRKTATVLRLDRMRRP
jgi:hypothetical protein